MISTLYSLTWRSIHGGMRVLGLGRASAPSSSTALPTKLPLHHLPPYLLRAQLKWPTASAAFYSQRNVQNSNKKLIFNLFSFISLFINYRGECVGFHFSPLTIYVSLQSNPALTGFSTLGLLAFPHEKEKERERRYTQWWVKGAVVGVVAPHRQMSFGLCCFAAPIVHDYSVRPSPSPSPIFTSQHFITLDVNNNLTSTSCDVILKNHEQYP